MGLETFFQHLYPKIDGIGRHASYRLHQLIKSHSSSPMRYVFGAIGIPASASLSIATMMTTSLCGVLDCAIQSIKEGKLVYGNIQTTVVYSSELWRSVQALFLGTYVALGYSPEEAAKMYLTIAADPHQARLNLEEAARIYAMGFALNAFFKKYGIDHRICSGTALGAIRDGGIILNDDDQDYMVHPDSVEKMEQLFESGAFTRETGIEVSRKSVTGGWQCFYADSPKKYFSDEAVKASNPDAMPEIGDPFIDIFPAVRRTLGDTQIFTYAKLEMSAQSPGDYFTEEEWGSAPTIYSFGPTRVCGVEREAMLAYINRCYGPNALEYKTLLLPHKAYADAYVGFRKIIDSASSGALGNAYTELNNTYSSLTQYPLPRFMRNENPVSTPYDAEFYYTLIEKLRLDAVDISDPEHDATQANPQQKRIWVDGIFDIFHPGHVNILKNALKRAVEKYQDNDIVLNIGVCGDGQDVQKYKRKPFMSLGERCHAVDIAMLRLVEEMKKTYPTVNISYYIIPNAPVEVDVLVPQKYHLNTMFHGDDFTPEKIHACYGEVLDICDFETLPYTPGVSTTALISALKETGTLGDCPNLTDISLEELARRVRERMAVKLPEKQAEPLPDSLEGQQASLALANM